MRNQYFYVAILSDFYQPDIQGCRRVSWIKTENGDPAAFATIEDAREAIRAEESSVYVLHNNEYSRPDYYIVSQLARDVLGTVRTMVQAPA